MKDLPLNNPAPALVSIWTTYGLHNNYLSHGSFLLYAGLCLTKGSATRLGASVMHTHNVKSLLKKGQLLVALSSAIERGRL